MGGSDVVDLEALGGLVHVLEGNKASVPHVQAYGCVRLIQEVELSGELSDTGPESSIGPAGSPSSDGGSEWAGLGDLQERFGWSHGVIEHLENLILAKVKLSSVREKSSGD